MTSVWQTTNRNGQNVWSTIIGIDPTLNLGKFNVQTFTTAAQKNTKFPNNDWANTQLQQKQSSSNSYLAHLRDQDSIGTDDEKAIYNEVNTFF